MHAWLSAQRTARPPAAKRDDQLVLNPVSPIHYLDCDDEGDGVWEEGRGGGMFQDKLCLSVLRVLDVQRVDTDGTPVLSTVS